MPKDYGLIGMITVFFALANTLIDSGFGNAYVQKKDATETDASSIFYFNIFISIIVYLVLWFCTPLIARFYKQELLINLIRVMALIILINAIGIIQIAKLTKDVNFKKKTIITICSTIISGVGGIIAAYKGYGVWSLVIQSMLNALILNIGLWFTYKWKPLFKFSMMSLKSMFSFSIWALSSGILRTFFDNIYILVIGKFFPAAELGFYTKSTQFQRLITSNPSAAVGKVAFPTFSELQNDKLRLKNTFRKFSLHTMFFIAPICAVLIVIARPLIILLLTPKWAPMVPFLQLLCVAGVFYPIHLLNVQVLIAQGKTKLNFYIAMIKNSLRIINIIIMYRFGVIFIIYGEIILSIIALAINGFYTKRFVNYGMLEQLKDLFSILITSAALTIVGVLYIEIIPGDYLKIIIGSLVVGLSYLGILFLINKQIVIETIDLIKTKLFKTK